MRGTRRALAVCVFLLLAVLLVFGRTVGFEFVNYDDNQYVYENPQVAQGLTVRGVMWALTTGHFNNWHPLTWLSYMLDGQLYGLQAGGYHLTNVLLHAAVAVLLFWFLWRMTGSLWPSAFVAAVFAVHPLRAESVAWVSERKDLLSGLFFVLTLMAYLGYARRPFSWVRYGSVAGLFALGLMAKPMLVTLPFVLLLLDHWPLGRLGNRGAGADSVQPPHGQSARNGGSVPNFPKRVLLEKLPLLALAIASCVATVVAQGDAVSPMDALPLYERIANGLVSYVVYLGKLLFPAGLAVFYPHPGDTLPVWKVIASALTLAGITSAVWIWRRRFPYLLVGWFWYLGMMVPVIGLVQVGSHALADRYTYLPQIGLGLGLTWGVAQLAASRSALRMCGVAAGAVILVLMGAAWQQTSSWRNSETLWLRALACTEDNHVAHNNLGNILAGRDEFEAAIAHFQKAVAIKPDYAEANYNFGIVLARIGQPEAAIAHYQKALERMPQDAATHYNLGIALAMLGRLEAAIAHYQKALAIQPDFAAAHDGLGVALARLGDLDAAIAHFQQAVAIDPDNAGARNNLDVALGQRSQRK